MNKLKIIGLLLLLVFFLITITPVQGHITDISEEIGQTHRTKANCIVEKPATSICCSPVVSPCVWALHCKCECRRLPY